MKISNPLSISLIVFLRNPSSSGPDITSSNQRTSSNLIFLPSNASANTLLCKFVINVCLFGKNPAMYKRRNAGMGNGMRGTRAMGRNVIFRGMSPNIPRNAPEHSGECHQTFRRMSSNIPGNVPLPHCFYTLVLWQQGKYN